VEADSVEEAEAMVIGAFAEAVRNYKNQ